jgi:DNA-binding NtrC family response regulator
MDRRLPLVLIVDDDAALCALLERFIRPLGFDVLTFPDGGPALASLHSIDPDVALVDLQMPAIGGLEVLRAIRDAAPDCRVVLMTGQPSMESAIQAVKLGALDYLTKPFDLDRLRTLLATIGRGFEQRREVFAVEASWPRASSSAAWSDEVR